MTLVPIEDVLRGRTQLKCPYCGGELTAKKGNRKEHHFGHTNFTCREVANGSEREIALLDHLSGITYLGSISLTGVIEKWVAKMLMEEGFQP